MVDGRWSMVDCRWSMVVGRWSMVDSRWSLVDGRWSMVDGRLSMVDGRRSMVDGRWSFFLNVFLFGCFFPPTIPRAFFRELFGRYFPFVFDSFLFFGRFLFEGPKAPGPSASSRLLGSSTFAPLHPFPSSCSGLPGWPTLVPRPLVDFWGAKLLTLSQLLGSFSGFKVREWSMMVVSHGFFLLQSSGGTF
jgi:hypothetical protein